MCSENLSLDEFYKHAKMKDGHLNICKECVKTRSQLRDHLLRENPAYVEKEKIRSRKKYHRLGYSKNPQSKNKKIHIERYKKKYPERVRANNKSSHIKVPKGLEKHHWNYNEGFEKDIIFLTVSDHNKLHRYTIYDQEKMMYRRSNGKLIDTREKCEKHIHYIKDLD